MALRALECPIWGGPAQEDLDAKHGAYSVVESPRSGGRFKITRTASSLVLTLDEPIKVSLTTWVVDQIRMGNPLPEINRNVIENAERARPLRVSERVDRLLLYLDHKTEMLGDSVPYSGTRSAGSKPEMLAWTASRRLVELEYLMTAAVELGLVAKQGDGTGGSVISLPPKGYERLVEIGSSATLSEQAFVAMWFHDSMDGVYENGFSKAIREVGYSPMRIDQIEHINKIDDEIIAEIRRSRFLVADFTCGCVNSGGQEVAVPRGGVYYEAGFAQGLGIPVVWSCRADQISQVHFDTQQFNHIVWSDADDLYSKLKNRIGAVLGDGPLRNS